MNKPALAEHEERLRACQEIRKTVHMIEADVWGLLGALLLTIAIGGLVLLVIQMMSKDGIIGGGWWIAFGVALFIASGIKPKTKSGVSGQLKLDVQLAAYDPIDREAYRHLQVQTLAEGRLTPDSVLDWLDAEEKAIQQAESIRQSDLDLAFLRKQI
ncbi:hypothetical protein D3C80_937260 [compost metagenome]